MSITAELVKMIHELHDKFVPAGCLRFLGPFQQPVYLRFNFIL